MKKPVRVRALYHFAWFWVGLLFVSCNLIPGTAITTTADLVPTGAGTLPTQPSPLPEEPVISLDLTATQADKQVLTSLLWLPDGKFVLAGSDGISLYQLPKTGLQPQAAPAFQTQVAAENPALLTSTTDGIDLAWIAAEHTVMYWNTAQALGSVSVTASDSPITGLALGPNKKDLAYSTLEGDIFLWDSSNQKLVQNWRQSAWLSDLSFSGDGQYLAGVDPSSFTATIYTKDGQVNKKLEWTEAVYPSLYGAFFSPDWKKLAWVSQSVVQFMEVATGRLAVLLSHEDAVGAVAWAPNSTLFATASTITQGGDITAAVLVWDSNTGIRSHTFTISTPVQSITFAPDNLSLAVLDVAGQMHVWRLTQ